MRARIHDLIADSAGSHPHAPALTSGETTLTYAQLWGEVRRAGAGLLRRGLRRHDRVAVHLGKRLETVAMLFGASVAGGVFVPVNQVLRRQQVLHILTDCGASVLVTTARQFALLASGLDACPSLRLVVVLGLAGGTGDSQGYDVVGWDDFTAGADTPDAPHGLDVDMAGILYTSGSTGLPKGVVLSHRNILVGAQSVAEYLGNNSDDVIAAMLPLSFDAGFSQLTTAFHVAAHAVLIDYLLADDALRLCARHGVTGLTSVPPQWNRLAERDWPAEAAGSVRYFANTGGRLPKSTLDRLRELMPQAKPFLMYGLTEAFRSTYLDPAEVDRRPASIGKAIPGAEIMVLRADGTPCDVEEPGELVHRGALVALGYWNDPVRTAERFKPVAGAPAGLCLTEHAVYSGDIVTRDAEGFLYFVGRSDDMIKTSGYRVSPTEVEEVAYGTGLVRDAVALGVEHHRDGQRILLVVTPAPDVTLDQEVLLAQLRRRLPSYMVPAGIVVRREISRGPNGKFDRALLRGQLTGDTP
jgi:acyl-CoA ligase (AMP-forming) (exosortase A-associated)